jgi:hypothetical protein
MICPRCGVINVDDAERCTRCRGSLAPAPVPSADTPAGGPHGADAAPGATRPLDGGTPPSYAPVAGDRPLPPAPAVPTPAWGPSSVQWPSPPPPSGAPHAGEPRPAAAGVRTGLLDPAAIGRIGAVVPRGSGSATRIGDRLARADGSERGHLAAAWVARRPAPARAAAGLGPTAATVVRARR